MSINGVLEDLALADVLQFVHLGRRTGTLYLWQDDAHRAEIGFHEGRIVSAWTPGHRKLGDLLVDAGFLNPVALNLALQQQRRERSAGGQGECTIGQLLLASGAVQKNHIHQVIKEQVTSTIFDLVTWRQGNFHFEVDELNPVDEIGLVPGEVLDDLDLNTQMLLLEATRIFDERHRDPAAGPDSSGLDAKLKRAGLATGTLPALSVPEAGDNGHGASHLGGSDSNGSGTISTTSSNGNGHGKLSNGQLSESTYHQRSAERPLRQAVDLPLEALRCQVVSDDAELLQSLRQGLPKELARVVSVRLLEAGNRLPGDGASPLVVLDLRHPQRSPNDVATLTRTRPSAPVLAVVDGGGADCALTQAAYAAGALAVVASGDSVVDCCRSLVRVFSHPQPQGTFGYGQRGGLSRFRQAIFDVQSGLLSATMALNLMHVISESVERAVLFLVQGHELRAVGAFGFASGGGGPLAALTRGLRLQVTPGGVLHQVMDGTEPLNVDFDGAELPPELARLLGRPASGQVVLFPVFGAERLISVIYTDNGDLPEEIQDIRILELATSQVGVAFENEILSQQMGGGLDGDDGPAS